MPTLTHPANLTTLPSVVPGPVVFYEEWIAGITATVNDLASEYLTWWFGTALDESCAAALGPDDEHRCWVREGKSTLSTHGTHMPSPPPHRPTTPPGLLLPL